MSETSLSAVARVIMPELASSPVTYCQLTVNFKQPSRRQSSRSENTMLTPRNPASRHGICPSGSRNTQISPVRELRTMPTYRPQ